MNTFCGNIGVGKSTLISNLESHFQGCKVVREELENPYLEKFYKELERNPKGPNKYALKLQKYFFHKRYENEQIAEDDTHILTDRCLLEYYLIFGANLYQQGLMSQEDFNELRQIYEELSKTLEDPDVIVFLKSSFEQIQNRIQKRNRDCERNIEHTYLQNLQNQYDKYLEYLQTQEKIFLIEIDTSSMNSDEVFAVVINKLKLINLIKN